MRHPLDAVIQRYPWPEVAVHAGDVGNAPEYPLWLVRIAAHQTLKPQHFADPPCQFDERGGHPGADIEDSAGRFVHGFQHAFHHVIDVDEVPTLLARSPDPDRVLAPDNPAHDGRKGIVEALILAVAAKRAVNVNV